MRAVTRGFLGPLLALSLVACAPVQFVEDYDPVLDQGLSRYQEDVAGFMAEMAARAGTPAGAYEDTDVQVFYARTDTQLQSFVDRAQALDDDGTCLPANFVGQGIKQVVDESTAFIQASEFGTGQADQVTEVFDSFGDGSDTVGAGNCTVVILKVVQANHEILQLVHEDNDSLPPIVVDILGPTLDQSVRIAIKNEVLKKNRAE